MVSGGRKRVNANHRLLPFGPVSQQESHRALFTSPSANRRPQPWESTDLDAIVVPTARDAGQLRGALELSAEHGVRIVVLCSKQSNAKEVVDLAQATPGSRVIAIDVPTITSTGLCPPGLPRSGSRQPTRADRAI
jgi:hypothetical protein